MVKKVLLKMGICLGVYLAINSYNVKSIYADITSDNAKNLIIENDKYNLNSSENLQFISQISKISNDDNVINKHIFQLINEDESLYKFKENKNIYFVGVNTGKVYKLNESYSGGFFRYINNNEIIKQWYYENLQENIEKNIEWKKETGWILGSNKQWYFYNQNGIMQTGWIKDRDKWYYCYSTGEMAHDISIDGYKLNSDGAWNNN